MTKVQTVAVHGDRGSVAGCQRSTQRGSNIQAAKASGVASCSHYRSNDVSCHIALFAGASSAKHSFAAALCFLFGPV